jgi:NADH:ubiquinone oxidoreductase subunit K
MAVRVAAISVDLCFGLALIGVGLAFVGVGAVVSGLQRLPLGTPASLVLLGISAAVAVALPALLVRLYRDRTPS